MYKANIEGIQSCMVRHLAICDKWALEGGTIESAKGIVEDYVVQYFDDLEHEGTIMEYNPTVTYAERADVGGFLVEVECVFPESCETDTLTFRTVVKAA